MKRNAIFALSLALLLTSCSSLLMRWRSKNKDINEKEIAWLEKYKESATYTEMEKVLKEPDTFLFKGMNRWIALRKAVLKKPSAEQLLRVQPFGETEKARIMAEWETKYPKEIPRAEVARTIVSSEDYMTCRTQLKDPKKNPLCLYIDALRVASREWAGDLEGDVFTSVSSLPDPSAALLRDPL